MDNRRSGRNHAKKRHATRLEEMMKKQSRLAGVHHHRQKKKKPAADIESHQHHVYTRHISTIHTGHRQATAPKKYQNHDVQEEMPPQPGQMTRFLHDVERYGSQPVVEEVLGAHLPVLKVKNDVDIPVTVMFGPSVTVKPITNPLIEYPKGKYYEIQKNPVDEDAKDKPLPPEPKSRGTVIPSPVMDSPPVTKFKDLTPVPVDQSVKNVSPNLFDYKYPIDSPGLPNVFPEDNKNHNDVDLKMKGLKPIRLNLPVMRSPPPLKLFGVTDLRPASVVRRGQDMGAVGGHEQQLQSSPPVFITQEKKGSPKNLFPDEVDLDEDVDDSPSTDSILDSVYKSLTEDLKKLNKDIPTENEESMSNICRQLNDIALKNGVNLDEVEEMIMNRRKEQTSKKAAENESRFNADPVFLDDFDPKQGTTRDTRHPLYF